MYINRNPVVYTTTVSSSNLAANWKTCSLMAYYHKTAHSVIDKHFRKTGVITLKNEKDAT